MTPYGRDTGFRGIEASVSLESPEPNAPPPTEFAPLGFASVPVIELLTFPAAS
jgi:hypothetical protein